jgi:hypothetical protein
MTISDERAGATPHSHCEALLVLSTIAILLLGKMTWQFHCLVIHRIDSTAGLWRAMFIDATTSIALGALLLRAICQWWPRRREVASIIFMVAVTVLFAIFILGWARPLAQACM